MTESENVSTGNAPFGVVAVADGNVSLSVTNSTQLGAGQYLVQLGQTVVIHVAQGSGADPGDDIAYTLTKLTNEMKDRLPAIHKSMEVFDPAIACRSRKG